MFHLSKLVCSGTSNAIKRIKGDENGKLVVQPSYECKLCSRVFDKRQAFKNHKFMHLKKKLKKLKLSPKTECVQNSSCSTETKLLKSDENIDVEESSILSNNMSQKDDKETIKISTKMHSNTFKKINAVEDKLKHETTNKIVNSSTNSQLQSGDSAVSLNIDVNRSYSCSFCNKVFTNKKTCLNHKKNHRKKRKSALQLTLTKSNFEQVITNFIRSIRQETESSKQNLLKCNSPFNLETVINNVASSNVEVSNKKEKSGVSSSNPRTSENCTPFKCDVKSLDRLRHFSSNKKFHTTTLINFNKQAYQRRIPLNQNIMPYC